MTYAPLRAWREQARTASERRPTTEKSSALWAFKCRRLNQSVRVWHSKRANEKKGVLRVRSSLVMAQLSTLPVSVSLIHPGLLMGFSLLGSVPLGPPPHLLRYGEGGEGGEGGRNNLYIRTKYVFRSGKGGKGVVTPFTYVQNTQLANSTCMTNGVYSRIKNITKHVL